MRPPLSRIHRFPSHGGAESRGESVGGGSMRTEQVDRRFLEVDAVRAGIHYCVEQDVGVRGRGEVTDLAGAGEESVLEVDEAVKGEGRIAIAGVAVGIDLPQVDDIALWAIEVGHDVSLVAG